MGGAGLLAISLPNGSASPETHFGRVDQRMPLVESEPAAARVLYCFDARPIAMRSVPPLSSR